MSQEIQISTAPTQKKSTVRPAPIGRADSGKIPTVPPPAPISTDIPSAPLVVGKDKVPPPAPLKNDTTSSPSPEPAPILPGQGEQTPQVNPEDYLHKASSKASEIMTRKQMQQKAEASWFRFQAPWRRNENGSLNVSPVKIDVRKINIRNIASRVKLSWNKENREARIRQELKERYLNGEKLPLAVRFISKGKGYELIDDIDSVIKIRDEQKLLQDWKALDKNRIARMRTSATEKAEYQRVRSELKSRGLFAKYGAAEEILAGNSGDYLSALVTATNNQLFVNMLGRIHEQAQELQSKSPQEQYAAVQAAFTEFFGGQGGNDVADNLVKLGLATGSGNAIALSAETMRTFLATSTVLQTTEATGNPEEMIQKAFNRVALLQQVDIKRKGWQIRQEQAENEAFKITNTHDREIRLQQLRAAQQLRTKGRFLVTNVLPSVVALPAGPLGALVARAATKFPSTLEYIRQSHIVTTQEAKRSSVNALSNNYISEITQAFGLTGREQIGIIGRAMLQTAQGAAMSYLIGAGEHFVGGGTGLANDIGQAIEHIPFGHQAEQWLQGVDNSIANTVRSWGIVQSVESAIHNITQAHPATHDVTGSTPGEVPTFDGTHTVNLDATHTIQLPNGVGYHPDGTLWYQNHEIGTNVTYHLQANEATTAVDYTPTADATFKLDFTTGNVIPHNVDTFTAMQQNSNEVVTDNSVVTVMDGHQYEFSINAGYVNGDHANMFVNYQLPPGQTDMLIHIPGAPGQQDFILHETPGMDGVVHITEQGNPALFQAMISHDGMAKFINDTGGKGVILDGVHNDALHNMYLQSGHYDASSGTFAEDATVTPLTGGQIPTEVSGGTTMEFDYTHADALNSTGVTGTIANTLVNGGGLTSFLHHSLGTQDIHIGGLTIPASPDLNPLNNHETAIIEFAVLTGLAAAAHRTNHPRTTDVLTGLAGGALGSTFGPFGLAAGIATPFVYPQVMRVIDRLRNRNQGGTPPATPTPTSTNPTLPIPPEPRPTKPQRPSTPEGAEPTPLVNATTPIPTPISTGERTPERQAQDDLAKIDVFLNTIPTLGAALNAAYESKDEAKIQEATSKVKEALEALPQSVIEQAQRRQLLNSGIAEETLNKPSDQLSAEEQTRIQEALSTVDIPEIVAMSQYERERLQDVANGYGPEEIEKRMQARSGLQALHTVLQLESERNNIEQGSPDENNERYEFNSRLYSVLPMVISEEMRASLYDPEGKFKSKMEEAGVIARNIGKRSNTLLEDFFSKNLRVKELYERRQKRENLKEGERKELDASAEKFATIIDEDTELKQLKEAYIATTNPLIAEILIAATKEQSRLEALLQQPPQNKPVENLQATVELGGNFPKAEGLQQALERLPHLPTSQEAKQKGQPYFVEGKVKKLTITPEVAKSLLTNEPFFIFDAQANGALNRNMANFILQLGNDKGHPYSSSQVEGWEQIFPHVGSSLIAASVAYGGTTAESRKEYYLTLADAVLQIYEKGDTEGALQKMITAQMQPQANNQLLNPWIQIYMVNDAYLEEQVSPHQDRQQVSPKLGVYARNGRDISLTDITDPHLISVHQNMDLRNPELQRDVQFNVSLWRERIPLLRQELEKGNINAVTARWVEFLANGVKEDKLLEMIKLQASAPVPPKKPDNPGNGAPRTELDPAEQEVRDVLLSRIERVENLADKTEIVVPLLGSELTKLLRTNLEIGKGLKIHISQSGGNMKIMAGNPGEPNLGMAITGEIIIENNQLKGRLRTDLDAKQPDIGGEEEKQEIATYVNQEIVKSIPEGWSIDGYEVTKGVLSVKLTRNPSLDVKKNGEITSVENRNYERLNQHFERAATFLSSLDTEVSDAHIDPDTGLITYTPNNSINQPQEYTENLRKLIGEFDSSNQQLLQQAKSSSGVLDAKIINGGVVITYDSSKAVVDFHGYTTPDARSITRGQHHNSPTDTLGIIFIDINKNKRQGGVNPSISLVHELQHQNVLLVDYLTSLDGNISLASAMRGSSTGLWSRTNKGSRSYSHALTQDEAKYSLLLGREMSPDDISGNIEEQLRYLDELHSSYLQRKQDWFNSDSKVYNNSSSGFQWELVGNNPQDQADTHNLLAIMQTMFILDRYTYNGAKDLPAYVQQATPAFKELYAKVGALIGVSRTVHQAYDLVNKEWKDFKENNNQLFMRNVSMFPQLISTIEEGGFKLEPTVTDLFKPLSAVA